MLDDLRNESGQSDFQDKKQAPAPGRRVQSPRRKASGGRFLGMTAFQRFVVSLLLLFMVCLLGAAALVFTGSVALF
jgi:hypothetical protein